MRLVLGLVSILGLWISPSTSRPGTDNDLFVEVSYPAENFNSLRAASYKASLSDPVSKICDIFNCANNVTDAVCCEASSLDAWHKKMRLRVSTRTAASFSRKKQLVSAKNKASPATLAALMINVTMLKPAA